jgi:hypothetical protein
LVLPVCVQVLLLVKIIYFDHWFTAASDLELFLGKAIIFISSLPLPDIF